MGGEEGDWRLLLIIERDAVVACCLEAEVGCDTIAGCRLSVRTHSRIAF